MNNCPIKSVLVLGSTSEIGQSIIFELAKNGCKRFHLVARDEKENEKLAKNLKNNFESYITLEKTDLFIDADLNSNTNFEVDDFDLYLIVTGSLGDMNSAVKDYKEALKITAANYTGLLKWITTIVTPKRILKPSRLWVFSSVAADRGRPSNYLYGAAKAALCILCEGLLLKSSDKPFMVRIIKPGFVFTRMSKKIAPKILSVTPKSVAISLLRNPNKSGFEYIPWWWSPIMILIKILPKKLAAKL